MYPALPFYDMFITNACRLDDFNAYTVTRFIPIRLHQPLNTS